MGKRLAILFSIFAIMLPATIIPARGAVPAAPPKPFYLPPLGLTELFRQVPAFVAPQEHAGREMEFTFYARWVNIWAWRIQADQYFDGSEEELVDFPFEYGTFVADMESYTLGGRMSLRVSRALRVEAELPMVVIGGGVMDGFIEGFHRAFGIAQHRRDDRARDEVVVFYLDREGQRHLLRSKITGTYLGNMTVGGTWLLRAAHPGLALRSLLKIPTGTTHALVNKKGADVSLQLLADWQRGNWHGWHGIGGTYYGNEDVEDVGTDSLRGSAMTSFGYRVSAGWTLLAHMLAATRVAELPELDEPVIEVTIGTQYRTADWSMEFGLIENVFYHDNSPDFGVHFSLRYSPSVAH